MILAAHAQDRIPIFLSPSPLSSFLLPSVLPFFPYLLGAETRAGFPPSSSSHMKLLIYNQVLEQRGWKLNH